MDENKLKLLITSGVIILGLSLSAIYVRVNYYDFPQTVRSSLELFASPGETIWWLTIGGFFAGYPSDMMGYLVLAFSNTFFWITVGLCLWSILKLVRFLCRSLFTDK